METPLTPLEFARRCRRLHGRREGVVDGDRRFTYEQFFARCDRWSAALAGLGVQPGDRVAYLSPNTHTLLESFYAVPRLGAVLVPINYRLSADDIAYILEHSGARVLCAHPDLFACVDAIRGRFPGLTCVALEGTRDGWVPYERALEEVREVPPSAPVAETDLLSINYTSGTTSRPKGVMITHRNAYLNSVGTLIHLPMTPADRYLWTLPMFHANGWTFTWTVTAVGAAHVCLRKVEARAVYELIARESISVLSAAPTVLISIASAPDDVRAGARRGVRVVTAGAPPAAATIQRVEDELGWPITHVYGLTETSPFITVSEPWPEHAALSPADRAAQRARQGVELVTSGEVRVVDADGREVPADGRTQGEITVAGNVVMKGYYNDPEATAQAFAGGWFHSGDVAVVHPDGSIEIRDRSKDVIISGGENISSVELEGALMRHPSVLEAAVVGLPDEKWGESPHAFVVPREGATPTEAELIAFLREALAHFKVPRRVHFVESLPKTATGKVQKFVLRGGRAAISRQ